MATSSPAVRTVPVELYDSHTGAHLATVQVAEGYADVWIRQYNRLGDLTGRYAVLVKGGAS